jgi:hypothetical protein
MCGIMPASKRMVQEETASPRKPPSIKSNKLWSNSWPTMRLRLAPSARRTAISFWRDVARAISRFATLAQAISRTSPTIAINAQSGAFRNCPTSWNQRASKLAKAFAITCGKKIEIITSAADTHNSTEAITLRRRSHLFARHA